MLCKLENLVRYIVVAKNGRLGRVVDFLFADDSWVIRYLVVETGGWLGGRRVLVSPRSIGRLEAGRLELVASVTTEEVASSPDVDVEKSLSYREEVKLGDHYGYPPYWIGAGLWGDDLQPDRYALPPGKPETAAAIGDGSASDSAGFNPNIRSAMRHLRSGRELLKYCVDARDGEVGQVDGLLVDDRSWAIRQLVVTPRDSWASHQVLVEPFSIEAVNWNEESVSIGVLRGALQPAFPLEVPDALVSGQLDAFRRGRQPLLRPECSAGRLLPVSSAGAGAILDRGHANA